MVRTSNHPQVRINLLKSSELSFRHGDGMLVSSRILPRCFAYITTQGFQKSAACKIQHRENIKVNLSIELIIPSDASPNWD
jgi:hypothetical protein